MSFWRYPSKRTLLIFLFCRSFSSQIKLQISVFNSSCLWKMSQNFLENLTHSFAWLSYMKFTMQMNILTRLRSLQSLFTSGTCQGVVYQLCNRHQPLDTGLYIFFFLAIEVNLFRKMFLFSMYSHISVWLISWVFHLVFMPRSNIPLIKITDSNRA